jgi:cysteine desulfurase
MVPIYLDYNATTPLLPAVVEAMLPFLTEHFGNPSSGHTYGRRAKEAVDRARAQVATFLGCLADEVLFTSGGTESNNLALRGHLSARGAASPAVVISAIEHPAVEEPCRALEAEGRAVTRVPVDGRGIIDLSVLEKALSTPGVGLVSVMHANNETGALQPIAEIARMAQAKGIAVHTDAAQSAGKVRVRVSELGVDLLSLAGHKLYAPKGVGALFVRKGTPLSPLLRGAGHERGLRPGTENVAGIVGLGAACAALEDLPIARLSSLAGRLWERLDEAIPGIAINGPADPRLRLPNTLNVSVPGLLGRDWLSAASEVAASQGSACHAGADKPSSVLTAMGQSRERALGAVRLTVGKLTTEDEIDRAATALSRAAKERR